VFEWGTGSSVFGEGQRVRHEGEPEEVEPLAAMTDRVGWGSFGLTHGSALAASGCPADLRSAGVCVARVDLRLWRPAEDSYLLGAGTGLELV